MSRTSKPSSVNRVPSPVRYFLRYSGQTGTFSYWDRDKQVQVDLGTSIDIVMLDTRSAVSGWCEDEAHKGRIYSNRVKASSKEVLNVRCGKVTLATGLWSEIKDKVKASGGKFCTEIFALANINGNWEPVQLDLTGGALGDWMTVLDNAGGKYALYNSVLTVGKGEQKKKGSVKYFGLSVTEGSLANDLADRANEFNDDMLQPYLADSVTQEVTV